jgi:hypothetical protein
MMGCDAGRGFFVFMGEARRNEITPAAGATNLDERRTMKKHWIAALAALALLPLAVTAQSPEERIHQAMTRAQEVGIPVSLLESKMAEGHAKGVPLDRIAMAIETRLQALERARDVMGRGAEDLDAAQISVGADALGAGVSEEVLQEMAASSGGERRAVAVAALTQLVLQGSFPRRRSTASRLPWPAVPRPWPTSLPRPGRAGPSFPRVRGLRPAPRERPRAGLPGRCRRRAGAFRPPFRLAASRRVSLRGVRQGVVACRLRA